MGFFVATGMALSVISCISSVDSSSIFLPTEPGFPQKNFTPIHLVWSRSVLLRYANQKPEQQISKLSFLIYVWVPEVDNTADTPNPLRVLPI